MYRALLKNLDVGSLVKREVDRLHWNYAEFSRALGCSRSSLYSIFNNRDISLLRLMRISDVLECDIISMLLWDTTALDSVPHAPSLSIPLREGRIILDGIPHVLLLELRKALELYGI